MLVEPRWVPVDIVVRYNQKLVALTGEPHFIRDEGLLESACCRPYNLWAYDEEADLVSLAVGLIMGLAKDHPFIQGNKRTAFMSGAMFLRLNGYTLNKEIDDAMGWAIVEMLKGGMPEDVFRAGFRELIIPYTDPAR